MEGVDVELERIEQVLAEWQDVRNPQSDPELEAVELAILLEDVLGAALTDDEIALPVLTDPRSVQRILARGGRH
jgi:hypothetical protein